MELERFQTVKVTLAVNRHPTSLSLVPFDRPHTISY